MTTKSTLLETACEALEKALHSRDKEDIRWNIEDALEAVQEAIRQIQGAREDAHRMAGRVSLDTDLLDMLAPEEAN